MLPLEVWKQERLAQRSAECVPWRGVLAKECDQVQESVVRWPMRDSPQIQVDGARLVWPGAPGSLHDCDRSSACRRPWPVPVAVGQSLSPHRHLTAGLQEESQLLQCRRSDLMSLLSRLLMPMAGHQRLPGCTLRDILSH